MEMQIIEGAVCLYRNPKFSEFSDFSYRPVVVTIKAAREEVPA